ncbi:MAG: biotin transporter BioY [Ruminococcus sp.]|nr:biotin transporter BioY [Ruminococcus sp.]
MKEKTNLLNLVYVAMFAAIITICAQIQIPTAVPFTLQTLGVFVASAMLGWKRGTLSVAVYILLGLIGVPVFAGFTGGAGVLFGLTGGYIIGFLFTAFIVGFMCDKLGRKLWVLALSMALGLLACYVFGTVWFMLIYNYTMGSISLFSALGMCVVPFLLFDAIKIAAAVVLVNRLDKVVRL